MSCDLGGKERTERVTDFFDKPSFYLSSSSNIRVRAEIIGTLIGNPRNSSILDIGCGDGSLSAQFSNSGNKLTLIDLSQSMLSLARRRLDEQKGAQCAFIHGDFLSHSISGPYDIIICVGVLAHVESVEAVLARIVTLLKPGGSCVLQWTDSDRILTRMNRHVEALRERLRKRRRYLMNVTCTSHIVPTATALGLRPHKVIRYSVMLPGMGVLPANILFRYLKATIGNPLADRISTDVVASFIRT
jgi:ubiquinone/menaquinone biosynthesis C-methylase UbiE